MPNGPDPKALYPMKDYRKLIFLKNIITRKNIEVGDYTYYDDADDPLAFENNVLYHFDMLGDKLIIGKFCAIASGVKFVMNGANHQISPISTFPFAIFENGWQKINESIDLAKKYPHKGDTIIGSDVWIGYDSLIMPGVKVGNGAVIASRSVITKDVPDYAVAGGNPATVIRKRFDDATITRLLTIAWWDWPADRITEHLKVINSGDVDELERIAVI